MSDNNSPFVLGLAALVLFVAFSAIQTTPKTAVPTPANPPAEAVNITTPEDNPNDLVQITVDNVAATATAGQTATAAKPVAYSVISQFTKTLSLGMAGNKEIVLLQDLLRTLGFYSSKVSSGTYDGAVAEAVRKFQVSQRISPANGNFGPMTRAAANKLISIMNASRQTLTKGVSTLPVESASSTAYGKIKISTVSKSGDKVVGQSITLRNGTPGKTAESINVTGFYLINGNNEKFVIPKAYNLPGFSYSYSSADDVVLASGNEAKIRVDRQDMKINFRENICTGYFTNSSDFKNELTKKCPTPSFKGATNLPDACIKELERTSTCKTPNLSNLPSQSCMEYANAHMNYQGCVTDNRSSAKFYENRWLVWMQRDTIFMRPIHDTITLYDAKGKLVDKYTY